MDAQSRRELNASSSERVMTGRLPIGADSSA